MAQTRTVQDLMGEAPYLTAPVRIMLAAGVKFGPVAEQMGSFSKADLSGATALKIDMHVGYRIEREQRIARFLIRESAFGQNRIVMDKTAAGWRVIANCDKDAKPWFVALVHLVFKITAQDCAKQEGREHRGRHDIIVAGAGEIVSGFIGSLAAPVASAR